MRVHEAYLPLLGDESSAEWEHRGHFFAAAAMRRTLVENARRELGQYQANMHSTPTTTRLGNSRPNSDLTCQPGRGY
jgi:hypothetical protein